jgi:hypothetical protein
MAAPPTAPAPRASAASEEARQFIRSAGPAVKECYEQALRSGLEPSGRQEIKMRIGADGKVLGVTFDRLLPGQLGRCLAGRLQEMIMSPPPGRETELSFPFIWAPAHTGAIP